MFKDLFTSFMLCMKSRKVVLIIYSWTALIGLFIAYRGFPPPLLAIELFLSMSSIGFAVYLYNDICDLEDDLMSKELGNPIPSNRPLGRGNISKRRMQGFIIFHMIVGLVISLLINLQVFFLQSLFLILGYIYSTKPFRLKKRFIFKQLTIALGGAISCSLGGFAVGVLSSYVIYFTVMSFILFFGVNPIIDMRDMEGDKAVGVKTFPVIWGPKFTIRMAIAVLSASILANIVGFYRLGFNIAFPILGAILFGATIFVIYPLFNTWQDSILLSNIINKRMYPLFLSIQISFLLGSLPI